jgi:hypothetical protein
MDSKNYLNFETPFLDKPVYRYITLDKFLMLFDQCQNVLSHPRNWADPFESFILNAKVKSSKGKLQNFGFRNKVYGQCWTVKRRSDALWQIFCPTKDGQAQGIRIRTTLRKLGETFSRTLGHADRQHAFIGKVQYLSDKKLFGQGRLIFMNHVDPQKIARSLLMKRNAFKHEAEVRLVYRILSDDCPEEGLFRYPVDPHALIDQVMIDPRFLPADASKLKRTIRNETGYKGQLLSSLLYSKPKGFVISAATS